MKNGTILTLNGKTWQIKCYGYRSAAFFARLYCGEVLNGIMTAEENIDASTNHKSSPVDIL